VEILSFSDRKILANIEGVYEIIKGTIEKKERCSPSPYSSPQGGEEVKQLKISPHPPKRGNFKK